MAAFPVFSAHLEPSGELVLRAAVAAYLGRYCGLTRAAQRVRPAGLPSRVRRPRARSARHGPDRHRTVCALVAGCALLPAVYRLPSPVDRDRLLPDLRHRGHPAAITGRLRPAAERSRCFTNARARTSAVRGPDHHRPAVGKSPNDFALIALLGPLGLRIFEACGSKITDLGKGHGHRVLRVRGKGGKVVFVPLPPAVARAVERAVGDRCDGPTLCNMRGGRMDRHASFWRLRHLAAAAGVRMPQMHPNMRRHTFVPTMLDAGVSLRDVQIAARHADPRTTMRYNRARNSLDRHPNCILAAYIASGT
ncbi:tyrosine-type recombinase/integrase [Dactylosporangium sp. NPDC051541]|uniref:tyrosine-type recombinase/integrase n=1 Tax=Dactylosporangium sp. NPDC051541 TaxID=3363977 RepID=UPI0037B9F810